MLIERLQAAVNDAARLSPEAQEALAAQIESAVRNAIWDTQLDDPRYDHVLRQMVEEAEQDEWLPFPTPEDMGDTE